VNAIVSDAVRASASEALALCTGEGAGGGQFKQLFSTRSAGETWRMVASTDDGTMPVPGTGVHLDVSSDATGWLWGARTPLLATSDDGATWLPLDIADGDVRIVVGADAWNGGSGTVLVWDPDRDGTLLVRTDDGHAWTERHLFPRPVSCCG